MTDDPTSRLLTEVNARADLIRRTVYHTYPFNFLEFNPDSPHSEDCGGCIIQAEVDMIIKKLIQLAPVEQIKTELDSTKEKLEILQLDREQAFAKAGVEVNGSLCDLVAELQKEKMKLEKVLRDVKTDVANLVVKIG